MSDADFTPERLKYLELLAEKFPSLQSLYTEIINLGATISLPKGTEHFMSDLHGEYEAFTHILNNCSGVIREKVNLWLGDGLTGQQVNDLCTLIYYPREKLKRMHSQGKDTDEWYLSTLKNLVFLARMLSSKYTRGRVRQAMPDEYAFVLDELLHAQSDEGGDQHEYHETIYRTLIAIGSGRYFVIAVCKLIKALAVDHLHVVGDIFDRGPRADAILDMLMQHHSVDIQWGNHDLLWMGAACGNPASAACVVRNSLAYSNTQVLENGYGISLRPLTLFAQRLYPDPDPLRSALEAITVILFKCEGQLILRHPEWHMEDRLLLGKIDPGRKTVLLDGREWAMQDRRIPTVGRNDPYALTDEEEEVIAGLVRDFSQSPRLRSHVSFLYAKGRMYLRYNENLLFHGCIPMAEDGSFLQVETGEGVFGGRALLDWEDRMARDAWYAHTPSAVDLMWYLWDSPDSPVCGRHLKTFERYFVRDEETWQEPRNPYYRYCDSPEACNRILVEFGLSVKHSRIINGHTPIRVTHGESPLKAQGKLIVIDGGFCRAYQKTTGIAGYTLIANSHGMRLMSHQPFMGLEHALNENLDIHSQSFEFAQYHRRRMVRDTDAGKKLVVRIEDLKDLLTAVRAGSIRL